MWNRITNAMPITCRVGSLCCLAKSMAMTPLPSGRALFDELLAADDADLGEPELLRRRHHLCGGAVLACLVRPQVDLRLHRFRGGRADLALQRRAVGHPLAVPVDPRRVVDVDLDNFRQHDRATLEGKI